MLGRKKLSEEEYSQYMQQAADLIQNSRGSDFGQAVEILYVATNHRIYKHVSKRTRSLEEAEDITSNVWKKVQEDTSIFETWSPAKGSLGGWFYTVWTNKVYDALYRDKGRKNQIQTQPLVDKKGFLICDVSDGTPDQESGLRDSETAVEIEEAVMKLSPKKRLTFMLRCEGYTFPKIGTMTGTNEDTAKSRYHHALKELQSTLKTTYDDYYR